MTRCKLETTPTQFVMWRVYLDEEEINGFHREDYYLAQICQLIVAVNSKNPKGIKLKDFLLKFAKEKQKSGLTTKQELRKKMLYSRAAWAGLLGIEIPTDDLEIDEDEAKEIVDTSGEVQES